MTRCKVCAKEIEGEQYVCSSSECQLIYVATMRWQPSKARVGHKRTLPERVCARPKCGKTYKPYVDRQKYCSRLCHCAANNKAYRDRMKARRLRGNNG